MYEHESDKEEEGPKIPKKFADIISCQWPFPAFPFAAETDGRAFIVLASLDFAVWSFLSARVTSEMQCGMPRMRGLPH